MTRAAAPRVGWRRTGSGASVAWLPGPGPRVLTVCREPGHASWRAGVAGGGRTWSTWCPSERAAKRAAVQLAKRLGGAR